MQSSIIRHVFEDLAEIAEADRGVDALAPIRAAGRRLRRGHAIVSVIAEATTGHFGMLAPW